MNTISPRIVAEVARAQFKYDCRTRTYRAFRSETLGRLRAVQSIDPNWEVLGWANEAGFVTYDYAPRHNLEWK